MKKVTANLVWVTSVLYHSFIAINCDYIISIIAGHWTSIYENNFSYIEDYCLVLREFILAIRELFLVIWDNRYFSISLRVRVIVYTGVKISSFGRKEGHPPANYCYCTSHLKLITSAASPHTILRPKLMAKCHTRRWCHQLNQWKRHPLNSLWLLLKFHRSFIRIN